MPFGLGVGETLLTFVLLLFVCALPLGVVVWAIVVLRRLQQGQAELLTRLAAIERRLDQWGQSP